MNSKRFTIRLNPEIIALIDRHRGSQPKSTWIKQAIINYCIQELGIPCDISTYTKKSKIYNH